MPKTKSATLSEQKPKRARSKTAGRTAPRPRPRPPALDQEQAEALNAGLFGIDDARDAADVTDASVEDPLHDWPESVAPEDDAWLQERDGEDVERPKE